jgi:cell division protein ZapA
MVSATTQVEIFGAVYHLHGSDDGRYLQDLAAMVDRHMREIADHAPGIGSDRLAILAALNLADELCQIRRTQEGERVAIQEKVVTLVAELNDALRE